MLYKKRSLKPRKYSYSNTGTFQADPMSLHSHTPVIEEIPLPNEAEASLHQALEGFRGGLDFSFFNLFKARLKIDDLILMGILFLLFMEGVEDEFLIIMLVYILLF